MNKVVIIGCGNVGMSYAYTLINRKVYVDELILIDIDTNKAIGEVLDLSHCSLYSNSNINIRVGNYIDCKDAKIVVLSAGINQKSKESRMDLIDKNSYIFKDIINNVVDSGFNGIFIVATNPLDIMTYITYKYSNFDYNKVIGSGTLIDTLRLRYILSKKLNINIKDINAYVLGEHGDTQFIPWSSVYIGGKSIYEYLDSSDLSKIEEDVKSAAYNIIDKKGFTSYAIGISLFEITNAILEDKNVLLPVSSYDSKNNICISTLSIIGKNGIYDKIDIPFNINENIKYNNSISVIKKYTEYIENVI